MSSYLQKRRQRWYAVLEIPKPLRRRFGRARFVRSLETDSKTEAERRVLPVVYGWKREIAEARKQPVEDEAAFWRRTLRNARNEEHRQVILYQIEQLAWDIGAVNVDQIGEAPTSDPEARRFYASATGALVPLTEHVDEWLAVSSATQKTKDMQRSDINRFSRAFESVQDVQRPEVRRWIDSLILEEGLKTKTIQRILSALRGYWRYLQTLGVATEGHEPFSRLEVARGQDRSSRGDGRLPFEPKDVLRLLEAADQRDDPQLADLIRLAMWSGCRIEELCSLSLDRVKQDHFSIADAKTDAGWRDVPIHSSLRQTITRLRNASDDGYVISGLTKNKYGDRANSVGKRFGRLKTELGFGQQHVFHSIRKTVVTILENAGVPENVVADIVGHEKTTMTYGLYSGGVSLEVKAQAIGKLKYQ